MKNILWWSSIIRLQDFSFIVLPTFLYYRLAFHLKFYVCSTYNVETQIDGWKSQVETQLAIDFSLILFHWCNSVDKIVLHIRHRIIGCCYNTWPMFILSINHKRSITFDPAFVVIVFHLFNISSVIRWIG